MGDVQLIAFRGEDGKPPRAKALRGLASLSFPAGDSCGIYSRGPCIKKSPPL